MKKIHGFFIVLFLIPSFSTADLSKRIKEESRTTQAYPCASRECPSQEQIQSYQYIFIDGFMTDFRPNAVNVPVRVLKKYFNVTDSFAMTPDSKNSIPRNADLLYERVLNLRAQSPHKKAILLAYSKGGAETLLMTLQHPELFTSGLITDLVIINGALQGTPLADFWAEQCVPKIFGFGKSDKFCPTLRHWQGGLTSLRPDHVTPVMNRALANLSSGDREFLSEHVRAVQSRWGDDKTERASAMWPSHLYLNRYGENDGALLVESQSLPEGFGKNLAIINIDHLALMNASKDTAKRNDTFWRALIREIVFVRGENESKFLAKGLL